MSIILNEKAIAHGDSISVYMEPRFVRLSGRWRSVPDVIKVTEFENGFIVHFDSDYIKLAYRTAADKTAIEGAKIRTVLDSWHFGHLINLALVQTDRLQFQITHSSGVIFDTEKEVYRFKDCPNFGLDLRQWKRLFKQRLQADYTTGIITIDLDIAFRDGIEDKDGVKELNLDPETYVDEDTNTTLYRTYLKDNYDAVDPDPWDNTHDASNANKVEVNIILITHHSVSCQIRCSRVAMRFDTSPYDIPVTARLRLYSTDSPDNNFRMMVPESFADYSDSGNYGQILIRVGDIIDTVFTQSGNWFTGPDLVAAAGWAARSDFDIALMEKLHDIDDVDPLPGGFIYSFGDSGAEAPMLRLQYPRSVVPNTTTITVI